MARRLQLILVFVEPVLKLVLIRDVQCRVHQTQETHKRQPHVFDLVSLRSESKRDEHNLLSVVIQKAHDKHCPDDAFY